MRYSKPLVLFALITLLVLAGQPLAHGQTGDTPPDPTPAANPLQASLSTSSVRLEYGQQQQIELAITNTGDTTINPMLYEAQPTPPTDVVPRAPGPLAGEPHKVALPRQAERIDPQIRADLDAAPDARTDFLVFLKDQPDLSAAYAIADWEQRGAYVYQTLSQHAEQSQHDLRAWLSARGLAHQPLWIVNAILVHGSESDVEALAELSDVALLHANHTTSLTVDATPPDLAALPTPADPLRSLPLRQMNSDAISLNLLQVGVDRVWEEFGITGAGAVVATIDSGAHYQHPALVQQYRGYQSDGSFVHDYNWFDPSGNSPGEPTDGIDHGTHVMGTMVARGDGSSDQPAVGLAPGARWIAARGCPSQTCVQSDLIEAAQWMLAPTDLNGENPRPDLRPHIINNSWAGDTDDTFYVAYVTAWRAAGIFPVFVTGNTGSLSCSSVTAPGEYREVVAVGSVDGDDTISSFSGIGPASNGAIKPDITAPGRSILSTFNRRPYGTLNGTSMAAPHVSGAVALLWSANPALIGDFATTYSLLGTTAEPITDDTYNDSQFAACPANTVPNNIYGYGRLDTYALIEAGRVDVPWLTLPGEAPAQLAVAPGQTVTATLTLDSVYVPQPGTYRARVLVGSGDLSQATTSTEITFTVDATDNLATISGSVRDQESDEPLNGTITIDERLRVTIDQDGDFTTTLPMRDTPYTLQADAVGNIRDANGDTLVVSYVPESDDVTLATSETTRLDFALLADIPRLSVGPEATTDVAALDTIRANLAFGEEETRPLEIRNTGSQPLTYTITIPSEQLTVWRSNEAGGPSNMWIGRPENTTVLSLTDDGATDAISIGFNFRFGDQVYDQVYVGSNGLISFEALPTDSYFLGGCLPLPETDTTAIAPLHMDLNPEQGGTVWLARTAAGLVVSYEAVPEFDKDPGPDTPIYSFQVLLKYDGTIRFIYGPLGTGELPNNAATVIQRSADDGQIIGCNGDIPINNGLALDLRPQPDARAWLAVSGATSGTLDPDEQRNMDLQIRGIFPNPGEQPYRGKVLIHSNDLRQPTVELPIEIITSDAPYRVALPAIR